jgi:hypothetical protein
LKITWWIVADNLPQKLDSHNALKMAVSILSNALADAKQENFARVDATLPLCC